MTLGFMYEATWSVIEHARVVLLWRNQARKASWPKLLFLENAIEGDD